MTSRVIVTWLTRQKTRTLVDAMKWMHPKGRAYFECDNKHKQAVWELILKQRAPSSAQQDYLDTLMLTMLFDMFTTKINQPDAHGAYPIHRATKNGHRQAVEMLLLRGVDIDADIIGGPQRVRGVTALTIAMHELEGDPPEAIRHGGKFEIQR
jgi:hypothetical protein